MSTRALHDLLDLDGKVAIVSGAGHGLGLAVAARLAEAGASVVLNDLDGDRVEAAAAGLRDQGRHAAAVAGDVADRVDVGRCVEAAVVEFGRVDVLVNNAGIWPREPFLEASGELWRRTLEVNLLGQLLLAQAAAARMIEQGDGGAIVNIASIAAIVPHPDYLVAYGASKAGVVNATKTLAKALAPHGIRVNVVLPGGMETPGVEESRGGRGRTSRSGTAQTRTRSPPRSYSSHRRSRVT